MRDKLDYLLSSLDMHIKLGKSPAKALNAAVEDYAYVYHSTDELTEFSRAATVALRAIEEKEIADIVHIHGSDHLKEVFDYFRNAGKSPAAAWELTRQNYAIVFPDKPQPIDKNPFTEE